uniref:Protein doublesex n=1 Tax=Schizaphis graminum TaxID=13262 RepID=A0A2S2NMA3_SCHGA
MNATTTSGRKRTRAATDRSDADRNTHETDRNYIRPRVSDPYPEMPASRHHHHHHQQQQQQQHVQVVTSTAAVVQAAQQSVKEKQRLCTNCKNHGLRKVWKKHKRYCKYRDCPCPKCMKTAATRKNCAEQTAKRRARQEDEQREQELQLNPSNFMDERPVPYQPEATTPQSCSRRNMSESSQVARSSTPKGTMSPRTSDFDDNSSSIDIVNGRDGVLGECIIVDSRDDTVDDRGSHLADDVDKKDIDADSRPKIMSNQIEHVKSILKELVGRTKDFQNLNAFRLFVLQHNTYDVDKATMLIKRGVRSKLLNQIKFVYRILIF